MSNGQGSIYEVADYAGRLFRYPGGIIELRGALRPQSIRFGDENVLMGFAEGKLKRVRRTDVSAEERAERDQENRVRCGVRAKGMVRRSCLAIEADRFITFTSRENIGDLDRWRGLHATWVRLYSLKYPKFKHVSVEERQQRGAWHTHMAMHGFLDLGYARELWQGLLDGPGSGSVNIAFDTQVHAYCRARGIPVAVGISGYLAKYFSKTDALEFGRHRYRSSQVDIGGESMRIRASSWQGLREELDDRMRRMGREPAMHHEARDWSCLTVMGWAPVMELDSV